MNNRKWIWFDLDDTLYDFSRSSLNGLDYIYNEYGFRRHFPTVEEWVESYHRHNRALWNLYNVGGIDQQTLRRDRFLLPLTEGGFTSDEADALSRELDGVYLDRLGSTGLLVEGARELLENLRCRGYGIGVLSNGFSGVQHRKLESSRIGGLVDCVVLSDEIGINKPDRRIFDYALQKAKATALESVMVGDNPQTDILGALRAGWRAAVLFDPQGCADPSGDSAQCGITAVVRHLSLVPDCLDSIYR